jgi:hypothetical protein
LVASGLGIDFDPYLYQKIPPDRYKMDSDYTGLGIGNPGINYRNPGHLLGLMDTFSRMSYGLNIIKQTRSFVPLENIGPIIDVQFPTSMIDFSNPPKLVYDPLLMSDIYPQFCEIPSNYINNININTLTGQLMPLPSVGIPYIPQTSEMNSFNLTELFGRKTSFSAWAACT